MRWLLLLSFLLFPPTVSADLNFELYASPLDPIVLPGSDSQYLIEVRMGANETGDNLLVINMIWETGSGWNYQGYTAALTGMPVVFNVSESDVNISGMKHRVTFENSTLQAPPLTSPENLTLTVNLTAPNVSLATYTLGIAAMWSFYDSNETEMREANSSMVVSKPDLYLSSFDIAFSNSTPTEGDLITMGVGVHNSGGKAGNFKVEFLVDSTSQANETLFIGASTTSLVVFDWASTKGTHTIDVVVDSGNVIDELNESNNRASKEIRVGTRAAAPTPAGGGGAVQKPGIVLLANSIDYSLSGNLTYLLKNQGIKIVYVAPENFSSSRDSKFIVILGGPDAPEGVGEIVREVLDLEEQDYLRTRGNRKMYVKTNVWARGQVVMIIAGSEREQTQQAGEENKRAVKKKVKGY